MDEKNRLTVPSKWRFDGDNEAVYLALPNPIGCVTLYPPAMIQKLEDKVSAVSLGNKRGQKALARLFSKADTLGCDKQGRITLSEKLVQHADLAKEAVLAGSYVTFHIWNPEVFQNYLSTDAEEVDEMSAILTELGL
ncbi:MAG: hypothetical protein A2Y14_04405 [Verrucomicrobia bacterium GWF2_51_19]|nr:MAG: hypothetical protein A2Y14_04405 [Verrucomicrobia bacterium GWF2_51_19]